MKFGASSLIIAGLTLGSALAVAGQASATIDIAVQTSGYNGGAQTTVATGSDTANVTNATYGLFTVSSLTGTTGINPVLELSDTINKVKKGKGVLTIWITETGITGPLGDLKWTSGFTENLLTPGWSVLEQTGISPTDSLYSGFLLSQNTFTAIGSVNDVKLFNTGAGPYSVTEVYQITANGPGFDASTISLSAVPEPASWAFMMIGLGGLGLALRRSRVRAVPTI